MTTPGLRVLVADDEPVARRRLGVLCADADGIEVVAEAADGQGVLDRIGEAAIDVVLLDIAMPGLDGLAVAEALRAIPDPPAIVFCTAYDAHALAAFDLGAIDYLLKPIGRERLSRAFERARAFAVSRGEAGERQWLDHLWVPSRDTMRRIDVSMLRRIDAEGDYVRLDTGDARYLVHETMANLEARLDPQAFARLRRSTIVRASLIRSTRHLGLGAWEVVLDDRASVRVGPTYWKALKDRLHGGKPSGE